MTREEIRSAAIDKITERIMESDDDAALTTFLTDHFSIYLLGFEDGIKYARDIETSDLKS